MASQTLQSDGKTRVAAVVAIASTYTYFLIFAQFGFLQAVKVGWGEDVERVRSLMAGMGIAGIAGSILAARFFLAATSRRWLIGGFLLCAVAAMGVLRVHAFAGFLGVAVLTGLGAGLTTVTLAGILAAATRGTKLGVIIGLGTGFAYGFCNLPGVFDADARTQALIAFGATALGIASSFALTPRWPVRDWPELNYSRACVAWWVWVFFALVCLDSALFYHLLQYNAPLREMLWDGAHQQLLNSGIHLTGAVLAGLALDRNQLRPVIAVAAGIIIGTAWWLKAAGAVPVAAGLIYMAGVSAYSTALVFYPARSGRPGLGALLYSIAGWSGSGVGIGLVADRGELSTATVATLTALLGIGLLAGYLTSRNERLMNEMI